MGTQHNVSDETTSENESPLTVAARRAKKKNDVEITGQAHIKKTEFLVVCEAC